MGCTIGGVSISIDPEEFSLDFAPLGSIRELVDGTAIVQTRKQIKKFKASGTCTTSEASGLRSLAATGHITPFSVSCYEQSASNVVFEPGTVGVSLSPVKGVAMYKYQVSGRIL
jgi:hypothetical protein